MDDGDLDWEFTTGSSNSFNFESELDIVLNDLKQTLMEKNRQYGNSALDPVRIFSRASTIEQLYVRIDDKLSRLKRGDSNLDPEDVFVDLFGYLAILMIARNKEKK